MNKIYTYLMLVMLLISTSLKSQERIYNDVELTFVKEVKLSDYGIYESSILSANERGDIVVFDYSEFKIAYASIDELDFKLFERGGRGRGPDEFQMIKDLKLVNEGNIYLTDRDKGTLTQWNTSGEFIKEFKPNKNLPSPARLARCPSGTLYILSDQYGKKGIFHRVSKEGKLLNSFFKIKSFEKRFPYYTDGRLACDESDFLYHVPLFINEIKKFNKEGEIVFKIPVYGFEENKEIMVKDGRFYEPAPNVRRATSNVFVRNGKMIVAFSGRKDLNSQLLDVYSSEDGKYEYSIEMPYIFDEIALTSKNVILFREDKDGESYITVYSYKGI